MYPGWVFFCTTNHLCLHHYLTPTCKSTVIFSSFPFVPNVKGRLFTLDQKQIYKAVERQQSLTFHKGGKSSYPQLSADVSHRPPKKSCDHSDHLWTIQEKKTKKADCCRCFSFSGAIDICAITLWAKGPICSHLYAALLNCRAAIYQFSLLINLPTIIWINRLFYKIQK